jgi:hypothetical protein
MLKDCARRFAGLPEIFPLLAEGWRVFAAPRRPLWQG